MILRGHQHLAGHASLKLALDRYAHQILSIGRYLPKVWRKSRDRVYY
jgi:hypothetical protein